MTNNQPELPATTTTAGRQTASDAKHATVLPNSDCTQTDSGVQENTMTTQLSAELFAEGFCFGEGPRWRAGHLWLSDMHDHKVVKLDDSGVA